MIYNEEDMKPGVPGDVSSFSLRRAGRGGETLRLEPG